MRAGKWLHALANTNIYAVPLFVISYCRPNVLKRQNGQEMQSQLVRYWWSVTQTKTASLGKGWSRQFISLPNTSVIMMDFKVKEGAENMLTPSTVGSSILTKSPIRKKSIFHWRTQFKIKQVKPQSMLLSYSARFVIVWYRRSIHEMVVVERNIAQLNK